MNISKKKEKEFDNIFNQVEINNVIINIDFLRKLFDGDFYDHFITHVKNKIKQIIKNNGVFYLHINISSFNLSDMYYYEKILIFSRLLHEFTNELLKIYIYGSSVLFTNLIYMVSNSLNFDIMRKIYFENKEIYTLRFENTMVYN
jgi:hypothetical protein